MHFCIAEIFYGSTANMDRPCILYKAERLLNIYWYGKGWVHSKFRLIIILSRKATSWWFLAVIINKISFWALWRNFVHQYFYHFRLVNVLFSAQGHFNWNWVMGERRDGSLHVLALYPLKTRWPWKNWQVWWTKRNWWLELKDSKCCIVNSKSVAIINFRRRTK